MKILIAGNGFIGKHLKQRLEDEHEVTTLGLHNADIIQDVTEEFELEQEFDVLFHLVGLAPGFHSKEAYRDVHVEGTRNLIDGVKVGKIVFVSALRIDEEHSFFQTKKQAEELVKDSGTDYTIIRPSTVYGEGNRLIEMLRRAAPTRIFPDIENVIQPIHIDDLTELLIMSMESLDNQVVKAAGPEEMKLTDFAAEIYAEEGYPCYTFSFPDKPLEVGLKVLERLPRPLSYDHLQLLKHQNTADENDAAELLELKKIFL